MRVSEWTARHRSTVITVPAESSLQELLDRLLREPCLRDLYVVDDANRLIGHVTHTRIAHLILGRHRPVHTRRQLMDQVACGSARELMHTDFPSAHPGEDLDSVLHRQLENDVEDMPVVADDGSLVGAVKLAEVLRAAHEGTLNNQ